MNYSTLFRSTLIAILVATSSLGQAQIMDATLADKMATDICKCLEKKGVKDLESFATNLESCFERTKKFEKQLKKHNLSLEDSIDVHTISASVVMSLLGSCDIMFQLSQQMIKDSFELDTTIKVSADYDCKSFFQGKFLHLDAKDPIYVYMEGNIQTMEFSIDGTYSKYELTWVDNCSYHLKYLEGTSELGKKWVENYDNTAKVQILEIAGDEILFLTTHDGIQFNSKMRRLEN